MHNQRDIVIKTGENRTSKSIKIFHNFKSKASNMMIVYTSNKNYQLNNHTFAMSCKNISLNPPIARYVVCMYLYCTSFQKGF